MGATGPDKEGVLVDLKDLVAEVQARLQRSTGVDSIEQVTSSADRVTLSTPEEFFRTQIRGEAS